MAIHFVQDGNPGGDVVLAEAGRASFEVDNSLELGQPTGDKLSWSHVGSSQDRRDPR